MTEQPDLPDQPVVAYSVETLLDTVHLCIGADVSVMLDKPAAVRLAKILNTLSSKGMDNRPVRVKGEATLRLPPGYMATDGADLNAIEVVTIFDQIILRLGGRVQIVMDHAFAAAIAEMLTAAVDDPSDLEYELDAVLKGTYDPEAPRPRADQ